MEILAELILPIILQGNNGANPEAESLDNAKTIQYIPRFGTKAF
jgi:hypothetical protein